MLAQQKAVILERLISTGLTLIEAQQEMAKAAKVALPNGTSELSLDDANFLSSCDVATRKDAMSAKVYAPWMFEFNMLAMPVTLLDSPELHTTLTHAQSVGIGPHLLLHVMSIGADRIIQHVNEKGVQEVKQLVRKETCDDFEEEDLIK